jgi:hypothetical protein
VQLGDLHAHLDAQLGVQVGQRLVEQEHRRLAHDGAAHGHALALTAGERLGLTRQVLLEPRILAASVTRRLISSSGIFRSFRPKEMFSRTVMCGYSA